MFSDTHFHFHHLIERGLDGTEILSKLLGRNMFFGLDIGTKCDDLQTRHSQLEECHVHRQAGAGDGHRFLPQPDKGPGAGEG